MDEPRFIVDVNVGRLATWLRALGYDTLFPPHMEDNDLIRVALREGRILVTKDGGFAERHVVTTGKLKVVVVRNDDFKSQLGHVVRTLGLDGREEFSRCMRCNELLAVLPRELAKQRVPAYVYETHSEFMECRECNRVYWRGTHWGNMRRELERLQNGAS